MQGLVHFDGSWSSRERALVERAIRSLERKMNSSVPDGLFGCPWICARHDGEEGRQYIARRIDVGCAFEAATAEDLVEKLELYMSGR